MRRFKPSPSTAFKLLVAAVAFTLGLAVACLRPRRSDPAPPALAAPPARAEVTVRDTFGDAAARGRGAVYVGTYVNHQYGYSVILPAGMRGAGSAPPAPDHGFGIDLDNPHSTAWSGRPDFPKSYLYVGGSYSSPVWERPEQAADAHLRHLGEEGRGMRVQSREGTLLGGLPAERVVARYEEDGAEMVSDRIVAFRRDGDGAARVVYTVALSTPLAKYGRDRPALEVVRMFWHLQPLD